MILTHLTDEIKIGKVRMLKNIMIAIIIAICSLESAAKAAHPLITDDTGTQGTGKYQFEFIGEYRHDSEDGVTTNSILFPTIPVVSYGVAETMDLAIGFPYQCIETKQGGLTTSKSGISDSSIQLKWRFYEKDGLSFAVKPGVTLPTGDQDRGLGNGKASYSAYFIMTKDMIPWAIHFNVGYVRNEYKLQAAEAVNRKDLWDVSFASEVEIMKNVKVVANIGMQRNSDRTSNTDPAFILGGLIYSVRDNLDLDIGVKGGLNKPETEITYLAGITWRL